MMGGGRLVKKLLAASESVTRAAFATRCLSASETNFARTTACSRRTVSAEHESASIFDVCLAFWNIIRRSNPVISFFLRFVRTTAVLLTPARISTLTVFLPDFESCGSRSRRFLTHDRIISPACALTVLLAASLSSSAIAETSLGVHWRMLANAAVSSAVAAIPTNAMKQETRRPKCVVGVISPYPAVVVVAQATHAAFQR
mmetsp:Transcript_39445/g.93450  ORF Transcript_39445/g.93450 Transcript_39445/m.93450 type:complete len:201 (+) Transcript_39445:858-1460(+)